MKRCLRTVASTAGAACIALSLSACGGGSSSTPHVNPTPTPPPPTFACSPSINIQGLSRRAASIRHTSSATQSSFTFSSNPSGLPVFVNGASAGATSFSTTPQYSNQPYTAVIRGSLNSFSVCYAQIADGNHTIYYNTAADTQGKLGTIAAASTNPVAHPRARATLERVPLRVHTAPAYDRFRIQVRFFAASIHGDERVAAAIEHKEGAPSARTLGPVHNGTMNRIVAIPAGETPDSFAARFRKHAEVADARPLPLRFAQSSVPVSPNDPNFDATNQWDLFRTSMPNAWGYTTGSPLTHIAIIDTGADLTHPDLAGKISYEVRWVGTEPPYPDRSAGAAQDYDGHGTNVSGIASADTNNGFGVAGVGWNVGLQIYRIFPTPVPPNYSQDPNYGASTADEAAAINDAIAHGARVINLSLGSCEAGGPDPTEFDAVEAAIRAGVIVVAAAGNERSGQGSGNCKSANTIDFPGGYPGVIAVGATSLHDGGSGNPQGATDYVSSYSNSGPGLAVVAPGGDPANGSDPDPLHWITNLYSKTVADPKANFCNQPPIPTVCLALFAGTSQATPHVSGVAGLMLSAKPSLGPAQVKRIVEATADNINDPNQGRGRLNAYRALAATVGDTVQIPAPTAANFVAIAYTVTPGSNKPNILNQTFTAGAALATNGSFRVADILPGAPTFEIGLWYDANGDGIVDQGDYFGSAGPCNGTAACATAATINVAPVPAGFVLH